MQDGAHGREGPDGDTVIATLSASAARRWLGVGALLTLGGMLLALAAGTPMAAGWRVVFLAAGGLVLWAAARMEGATRGVLELTPRELRERDGDIIARLDEVVRVDRSMFAIKPSNGFLLTLSAPGRRAWRPGLWWRLGRRVAIGGVTPGSQSRPMADAIALLIAERD
ncbi:hypothetical protein [Roseivivax isoporae]|uniref:Uncharacterized protein n=1 Tax=Roseivivax isoporae LMG 25204 TaxID=1449351 RepID=X7F3J3_9RHOB|nr:hypothetical protein [Roseivivax isoporae]ETX27380.1 hypothetical protein RISW2_14385 [Roseivivax isoporae LMG 25204]